MNLIGNSGKLKFILKRTVRNREAYCGQSQVEMCY